MKAGTSRRAPSFRADQIEAILSYLRKYGTQSLGAGENASGCVGKFWMPGKS